MKLTDDHVQRELARLRDIEADDLAVRRVRDRLRSWASENRYLDGEDRWRVRVMAVGFIALLIGLAVGVWRHEHEPAAVPQLDSHAVTSPVASVEADDAEWHSIVEDQVEKIDLSEGTLRLHVKHPPGGKRRVVVRVPDGEIEDIGTIFHVVVRDGRTERVGVDEGSVTIRIRGLAPLTIGGGQTWERGDHPVNLVADRRRVSLPAAEVAPPVAPSTATDEAASQEREDALYLSVIRALRDGRGEEARVLGRQYLKDFPDGFRRDEVSRLVNAPRD